MERERGEIVGINKLGRRWKLEFVHKEGLCMGVTSRLRESSKCEINE